MPESKRPLKVFLCHAHADRDPVRGLYARLTQDGVDAWLDKAKLLPGQDWELEIRKAVREADVVVVCLSKQFNQAGFRQKEVRLALDTAMEKPEGEIFIIPARLEECDTLESLRKWHWVDLFEDSGYEMLIRALQARADSVGSSLNFIENTQTYSEKEKTSPVVTQYESKASPSSSLKNVNLLHTLTGHTNWVWGVAISPDMQTVVSGGTDATIRVCELLSGKLFRQLTPGRGQPAFDSVISIEFNHAGRILASGHKDGSVHLWRVGRWLEFKVFSPDRGQDVVKNLAFSPDDQYLFAAGMYGTVCVYELNSLKMVDQLKGHTKVAFNAKMMKMTSMVGENNIQIFDLTDKKEVFNIGTGLMEISSLALSPNGNLVAGGNEDFGIQLWDTSSEKEVHWLQSHTGSVRGLEFSPDGSILASGGEDNAVYLWDVATGKPIERLDVQAGVNRLRFSSDGTIIVTGNGGPGWNADAGTVQIWKIF